MAPHPSSSQRIALNALLLSGAQSFRRAGIHKYIYNSLRFLPEVAPELEYTAIVAPTVDDLPRGLNRHTSQWDTTNPTRRILWEQSRLPSVLNDLKPSLHHSMAYALPIFSNTPSIVTIYDLSFFREPERLTMTRRLYLQNMVRHVAHKANRLLAISEAGRAELNAVLNVPLERIDVAYPGVDEQFQPLPAAQQEAFKARTDVPKRFILHVGTIEPRKNLEMLLQAYAMLERDVREEVKLVLIGGKGWQTDSFFAQREGLGLTDDVILPGYIPDADLPYWYNCAELFVYPSVYEGFGIPITEALACGVPVIASDRSSLPEAAGSHSVLLPPNEPRVWADAIKRLLTDHAAREQMVELGLAYVQRFTWRNTAQSTIDAYRRIIG